MEKIKTINFQERETYCSPEADVISIKAQELICTSPNSSDPYGREDW